MSLRLWPTGRSLGRPPFSALILAGVLGCCAVGCSDSGPPRATTYPVSTTITFQGKPIPGAFVALHPKTPLGDVPTPRANIGKEGELKVTTYDTADGAPAGEYVVTVEWYKPIKQGGDVVAGPNVIPRKYASPKTSPVVIKVAEGTTEFPPIQIK